MSVKRMISLILAVCAIVMVFQGDTQTAFIVLILSHLNSLSADVDVISSLLSKEKDEK